MKYLYYLFTSITLMVFACTPAPTVVSPCDNVPQNQVCFGDQMIIMNAMSWSYYWDSTYNLYLTRDYTLGEPGPYIQNQITLYNGGSSGIPELGVYNIGSWPNTNKYMDIFTYDGSCCGCGDSYVADITSIGLEITSINGTNISGVLNCKMLGSESNSKTLKINFVDVPKQ